MKRSLLRRRELVERFVSEARLVAQLDHPGIVRIHGVGHTPNRGYFLVMDLCERGDLQRRLSAGPVGLADALRWTAEAAAAIAHAHQHGVIHCDLKPSNLLLADDGRIVVSDFGLARAACATSSDLLGGTPAYLAPEQLDSRWGPIGFQTDVHGLGAVLYSLLSGHPPRTGTLQEILDAVSRGEETAPPDAVAPESIAAFMRSCLSSDARRRPGSVLEFSQRLHGLSSP